MISSMREIIYSKLSPFAFIQVLEEQEALSKITKRVLLLDGGYHAAIYLNKNELVFPYTNFFRIDSYFNPNIKNALALGGGGYTIVKDFLERNKKGNIDVVEIDPEVTKVARNFFFLKDDPRLEIFHQDALSFIEHTNKKYDAIYFDIFSKLTFPPRFATSHVAKLLANLLCDDGVVIINLISQVAISSNEKTLFAKQIETYQKEFTQVYYFPLEKNVYLPQNIILVATKRKNFSFNKNDIKDPRLRRLIL